MTLTERARHGALLPGRRGNRVRSGSSGWGLVWVVEEELVAVEVVDDEEFIAPPALLDRNPLGHEFCAKRVQCCDCSLARLRLDVQGNEHQPLANLFRPPVCQDQRAALPLNLRNI